DESALTGEAVPVPKSLAVLPVDAPLGDRRNMAYAGSFVTTGDLAVARTMAIQALVAARMVYLVSISQLGADIGQYVRGRTQTIAQVPILMVGMVSAIALQILFSQWGVMNTLFATAPLTGEQWLICLGPMLPMIPTALWVNRLDALSRPAASQP
ncbi:MAG: cation transporting ATPase C-terminal domain-containing protein, partial [Pseudanabaenaceae cyanobacterium]